MLVVDGGGSLRSALVGDLIAGIAVQRGWAGLIIWGAVRDSVALDLLDLGIKALGTNPQKSRKTGHGVVNGPIEIGGVWIAPGQTVHPDEDGIVVVGSYLARRRAASPATCPSLRSHRAGGTRGGAMSRHLGVVLDHRSARDRPAGRPSASSPPPSSPQAGR